MFSHSGTKSKTEKDPDGRICVAAEMLATGLEGYRIGGPAHPYGRVPHDEVDQCGDGDDDQSDVQRVYVGRMEEPVHGFQDYQGTGDGDHAPLYGR